MKPMIPVIVEDLINKVNSNSLHPEQKQHYVKTLEDIRNAADEAIKNYDKQRKSSRR